MARTTDIDSFVDRIMDINIIRNGGASAGIFGSTGTDNIILHSLKKATISFATEYKKPKSDSSSLNQLSNNIYGYIQTLQLTYTLSELEANKLMAQLQDLL